MRRPSPHHFTGSVRRLVAAAVLAALAAVVALSVAVRPAAASGPLLGLDIGVAGLSVNLPLPSLLPAPPPTTSPQVTLPGGASVPVICPTACNSGPNGPTGSTPPTSPGAARGGSTTGHATSSSAGPGVTLGGSSDGGSASSALTVPRALGLAVSPPPPVEQLTPLAGISFGQAPYLWPLFVLLDVVALGAVILLVRRSWSPARGSD